MALTTLEQNTVSRACQTAKTIIEQIYPLLLELDIIYNSSGGAKTTITQPGLDAITSFSGLTKNQLDDGLFALTSTIKADVLAAYTQLAQIAARG